MIDDRTTRICQLQDQLEQYHRRQAKRAGWVRRFIPTGLAPLDEVLPGGGLPCGSVTEIVTSEHGVGEMALSMRIAGSSIGMRKNNACLSGGAGNRRGIVLLDVHGDFYPPAIVQQGIALGRLTVLRVRNPKKAFWAVDQALRCSAVAVVIAPLARLDECASRRLQLAAERSGNLGLIITPYRHHTRSFASIRMLIERVPVCEWHSPRLSSICDVGVDDHSFARVTLLKVRESAPTRPVVVDLQHETGDGYIPPLSLDRSMAKTG